MHLMDEVLGDADLLDGLVPHETRETGPERTAYLQSVSTAADPEGSEGRSPGEKVAP